MSVVAIFASLLSTADLVGADVNAATQSLGHACTITPVVTSGVAVSGADGVVAGEVVTVAHSVTFDEGDIFQDVLVRPDGSTYWASYIETILPATDLVLDPASIEFSIAGAPQPVVAGTQPDPANWVLETSSVAGGTVWRILFPADTPALAAAEDGHGTASYTVPVGGETFTFSFDVSVPIGLAIGEVEKVVECFASVSTGPSNRDTNRLDGAVALIEPAVEVAKRSGELVPVYSVGNNVSYEVEVRVPEVDANGYRVADAYDTVVVDQVPAGLTPVVPIANGGVWDVAARTITWSIAGPLTAGSSTVLDYDAVIESTVTPGSDLLNTVSVTTTGLPGAVADETTTNPVADDEVITVASPPPEVVKNASIDTIDIGVPFEYTVTVNIPAGATYENFTVLDTLPNGIQFNSYVAAACAGAVCPGSVPTLAPTGPRADGSTVLGWYPNSLGFDPAFRTLTLTYEAEILPTYLDGTPVELLDGFTNTVEVLWNNVDRLGDVPPSTAAQPLFDGADTTTEDVVYNRPILVVDKTANRTSFWDFAPGESVTYSVTVTNVGQMDAVNIAFEDTMSALGVITPGTVTIDGSPCVGCGIAPLSGTIAGPLAPGASAIVTYEVTPTGPGTLAAQSLIENTFEIPTYEDPGGTTYTEAPSDNYLLRLGFPEPAISKSIPAQGLDAVFTASSTSGTPIVFEIDVDNVGNGTFYNPTVIDTPPAGLCLVPGSGTNGVVDDGVDEFTLPGPILPGTDFVFQVTYEVCGAVDVGVEYLNVVDVFGEDFADNRDQTNAVYTATGDAAVWFTPPSIELSKTPDLAAGATVPQTDLDDAGPPFNEGEWTITVENTGSVPAYNLAIDDVMPETLEYMPGDATVTFVFGAGSYSLIDNSAGSPAGSVAGLSLIHISEPTRPY